MTPERLSEIEARCNAATQGPWLWHVNVVQRTAFLGARVRTASLGFVWLDVMRFRRWGMTGAQPTFYRNNIETNLTAFATPLRNDIDHPDARFIESARQDVEDLVQALRSAQANVERLTAEVERMRPVNDAAMSYYSAAGGYGLAACHRLDEAHRDLCSAAKAAQDQAE